MPHSSFLFRQISSGRTPAFVHLSPVLDLLGVRYVIAPNEDYTRYFVLVNESALPRAFVPRSVEVEPDRARRLAALANVNFDPRQVAYVEDPAMSVSAAEGEAVILEDTPQQIVVSDETRHNPAWLFWPISGTAAGALTSATKVFPFFASITHCEGSSYPRGKVPLCSATSRSAFVWASEPPCSRCSF